MKLLLLLIPALLAGQTLTITGPATARAGQAVPITLSLSGSTSNGPAALQWTLVPPAGFTHTAPVIGAQGTAAGKLLRCNPANTLCLVYGVNQNVIGNGAVASLTVSVPPSAAPGSVTVPLSGLVAVSRTGSAMALAGGPAYSLIVTVAAATADLDGDGKVTAADVGLMANQVVAATCTSDQNGDGRCDLIDVFIVVLRALGV